MSTASAPDPTATDPGAPFGGLDNMTFYTFGAPLGWPAAGAPVPMLGGLTTTGAMFNAVHMCVIPKGPHRGKVLVMSLDLTLAKTPGFATQGANDYYSMQPWAIVDPAVAPAGKRFENFFLPIEPAVVTGGLPSSAPNLFCCGHAWSPYGDLVVVGGTTFATPSTLFGAKLTYVFNPDELSAPFPGQVASLYAAAFGHWVAGPQLENSRWYPTATLTSRIPRVQAIYPTEGEVMLVAGGSRQFNPQGINATWNSYEALRFTGPSMFQVSGIEADFVGVPPTQVSTWDGPGTVSPAPLIEIDWLHEYPRLHQLSNGRVFFSGYAQRGALLDHDIPGTWVKSPQQPAPAAPSQFSSNWQHIRHDGSSVLLPAVNGVDDMVMRIGGGDESPGAGVPVQTTAMTEVALAGSFWNTTPKLPATDGASDGGRMFTNVLPLPTGALLLLGGENHQSGTSQSMPTPLIYAAGAWHDVRRDPYFPVTRTYHATAVLLPDGRVFIGGGNSREIDYEIYSPYYLQLPASHKPTNVQFQAPAPPIEVVTGAFELNYGSAYGLVTSIVDPSVSVSQIVLTSPAAMTHHSDMHARHVQLKSGPQSQTSLTFNAPDNDRVAPRGVYMLWVITTSGAVSEAIWVVLR